MTVVEFYSTTIEMPLGITSKSTMGVMYQNPHCWGEMAPSVQIDVSKKKLYVEMKWNSLYCTHENWNKLK